VLGQLSACGSARTEPATKKRPGLGLTSTVRLIAPRTPGTSRPFVEQYRLGELAQRRVRVSPESDRLGRLVETDHSPGMPYRRGGLTGRPRPDDQHRWQLTDPGVHQPRQDRP
jgi:hypothetical protein